MKIKPIHVVLTLAVLAALFFFWRQQALARALFKARQNNAALTDSVRIVTTKNGELEAAKLALVGDKDDLEKLNKELADELEKERGNVKYITKIETVIRRDTVEVPTVVTVLPDSTFRLDWDRTDSTKGGRRSLAGNNTFRFDHRAISDVRTQITKDELRLTLITGLREREGDRLFEIFVRTDYPGVSFPDIQGAVVDVDMFRTRRPQRWSVGPVLSAGVNQDLKPGIHAGFGVQYSLFRF